MPLDAMIEFRLKGPMNNRIPNVGKDMPGERIYMRTSAMMCLFPDHHQIRTIEYGWTVEVCTEDWPKVEKAFRSAYLGGVVKAMEADG